MACTMLYLDDPFFSVVVGRLFIYLFPLLWSRIRPQSRSNLLMLVALDI